MMRFPLKTNDLGGTSLKALRKGVVVARGLGVHVLGQGGPDIGGVALSRECPSANEG